MPQFDVALVAYTPDGARLGPLPAPLQITAATNPLNDMPTLSFDYLASSPGAQHLEPGKAREIAIEVLDPSTGVWFEPRNSRYMVMGFDQNQMDAVGRTTYTCPGYANILDKIVTRPPSKAERKAKVDAATVLSVAAQGEYTAAARTVRMVAGVPGKSGIMFSDYSPKVSNNSIWVQTDDDNVKAVWKGVKVKKAAGRWVAVPGGTATTYANIMWDLKRKWDEKAGDVTRAKNDKNFDRIFENASAGKVLTILLNEAKAREDRIPQLTWDFTATKDSDDKPWTVVFDEPFVVQAGQSVYDVLQSLVDQGLCDWTMQGRDLRIYNPDTYLNRDRTSYQLIPGIDIKDAPDKGSYDSLTHNVLFLGDEGLYFEMNDKEMRNTPWGRWEKAVNQGGVTSRGTGKLLGGAALAQGAQTRTESTRDLIFDEQRPLPYIHYVTGDKIRAVGSDGTLQTMRVRQITLSRDDKGTPYGNIVLGDRFLERALSQSRKISGIMGGAVGAGNGSLPVKPVTPTERTPEAPHDVEATPSDYTNEARKRVGRILLEWQWDGTDTRGSGIEIDGYQVQIRTDTLGQPWTAAASTQSEELILDDLDIVTAGGDVLVYEVRVRAISYAGRPSEWSDIVSVPMEVDLTPPPVPSAPKGKAVYGVITVTWDGRGAGGESMPKDFDIVEGEIAPAPAGPWQAFGTFHGKGSTPVPFHLPYGTYWLRLRSQDLSGNQSAWSALSSATSTKLVELPDIHDLAQKVNTQIEGVRQSANGKNRRIDSQDNPKVDGKEQVGDSWFKWTSGEHVADPKVLIGQWTWMDGKWEATAMGHQTLASIDLGKATIGFLDGIFIKTKTLNADHLLIGDFTNLATLNPELGVNTKLPVEHLTEIVGGLSRKAAGGSNRLVFMDQGGPVPVQSGQWVRVSFLASATANSTVTPALWVYPNETGTTSGITGVAAPVTVTPGEKTYTADIQVPDLASIGGGKSWYVGLDGAASRNVGIKQVRVYKKMDATLISPGSIDTPHLRSGIIESDHIKANTIETDRLVGGFFKGLVVEGALIQTSDVVDKGIKLDNSGMRAYHKDGGRPVFEVRLDGGTTVGVSDPVTGDILAGMDKKGIVAGQGLNVANDPIINGDFLLGTLLDWESPTTYEPSGILDQLPRGLIARGTRNMQGVAVAPGERAVMELQFIRYPGRSYMVTINPVSIYAQPGVRTAVALRATYDGSKPTLSTTMHDRVSGRPDGGSTGNDQMLTLGGSFLIQSGSESKVRLLFTIISDGGTSTFYDTVTGGSLAAYVEDVGMSVMDTGINRGDKTGSETDGDTSKKNYTKVYKQSNYRSYLGSGATYIRGGSEVNKMYQGDSPWPPGGALRSIATFPNIQNDIEEATVTSIRVKVRFDHWWYHGSDGIADLTLHGKATVPSTLPASDVTSISGIASKYTSNWPDPGTRWVPIPSSYWNGFKNGTYKGVGLGDGASGLTHYGYGQVLEIEVKYTK